MLNETPLRRSQLGIPGNESQLITAALESGADEIFLDLEDSVAPGEKQSARSDLIDVVETQQCDEMVLSYRINGTDTRWWYNDVIEVVDAVGEGIDTLTIPKVRGPSDVQAVTTLLEAVETNAGVAAGSIGVNAQIETATGMSAITEIAHATDRLRALVFGPADYAASIGASHGSSEYPGHYWHYPLSRVSQAASSAGLLAIGGPYTDPHDEQGLQQACTAESALGYDGKIIIHPDQIETVNRVFSPDPEEADRARRIVDSYEQASATDVAAIDGKIIDQEMYRLAKRIVSKAEKSDLS